MEETGPRIKYLVFDVEAIADGELIRRIRYPKETLTAEDAIARYRAELLEERGSDVIPWTFMLPCSSPSPRWMRTFE